MAAKGGAGRLSVVNRQSTASSIAQYKDPAVNRVAERIKFLENSMSPEQRRREELLHKGKPFYIIDPRKSKLMGYWDLTTSLALIFTAIVTPVEVAFVSMALDRWRDPLFLINRLIDLIFLLDIGLQFVLMYPAADASEPGGERWVSSFPLIAKRYIRSAWFAIDCLSIGVSFFDMFAPTGGTLSRLKGLRAVRVLRLVKLVRIVNASRVFKRWELRLSINYQLLGLSRLMVALVFGCHLFACLWGLQASFDMLNTWPGQKGYCTPYEEGDFCAADKTCDHDLGYQCEKAEMMYLYSIYFALATITSIGYGDIHAAAFNAPEQVVCAFIMLVGALMFAYLIGNFCALASSLNPDIAKFRFDLSDLNLVMSQESLPEPMRYRLREYMHQTGHLRSHARRVKLFDLLSSGLSGEFALRINGKWLRQIPFLVSGAFPAEWSELDRYKRALLEDLARSIEAEVYAFGENCPPDNIYVLAKGRVLFAGHVYKVGQSWGHDALIRDHTLRHRYSAIAIVYVWAFIVNGKKLRTIVQNHPRANLGLRKLEKRWTIQRRVVRHAEEVMQTRGQKAFHGRWQYLLARHPNHPDLRQDMSILGLLGTGSEGSRMSRESRVDPSQDLDPEILGETRSIGEEQRRQATEMARLSNSLDLMRQDMQKLLTSLMPSQPVSGGDNNVRDDNAHRPSNSKPDGFALQPLEA